MRSYLSRAGHVVMQTESTYMYTALGFVVMLLVMACALFGIKRKHKQDWAWPFGLLCAGVALGMSVRPVSELLAGWL